MYLRWFYSSVEHLFLDPVLQNYNIIIHYETAADDGLSLVDKQDVEVSIDIVVRWRSHRNLQETTVFNIPCLIYIVDHHWSKTRPPDSLLYSSSTLCSLAEDIWGHSLPGCQPSAPRVLPHR